MLSCNSLSIFKYEAEYRNGNVNSLIHFIHNTSTVAKCRSIQHYPWYIWHPVFFSFYSNFNYTSVGIDTGILSCTHASIGRTINIVSEFCIKISILVEFNKFKNISFDNDWAHSDWGVKTNREFLMATPPSLTFVRGKIWNFTYITVTFLSEKMNTLNSPYL